MTRDELHAFLTAHFGLVTDARERGSARSYFLGTVVWHPSTTTRILHVQFGADAHVSHIKRCLASDNNNSVFVRLPIGWEDLHGMVAEEIAQCLKRLKR